MIKCRAIQHNQQLVMKGPKQEIVSEIRRMICPCVLADVPQLNILVNRAYRGDSSRKGWTTEADLLDGIRVDEERLVTMIEKPDSIILKALDESNKLIGCVHLEKQGTRLYLGMLTVDPLLQSRGTGKQLLAAAEDEARKRDCTSIFMTVIDTRTELINWYVRHGFQLTSGKKPFPADDPQFGLPKKFLEFVVLEKQVSKQSPFWK